MRVILINLACCLFFGVSWGHAPRETEPHFLKIADSKRQSMTQTAGPPFANETNPGADEESEKSAQTAPPDSSSGDLSASETASVVPGSETHQSKTVSDADMKRYEQLIANFQRNIEQLGASRYAYVARGIELRRLTNRLATVWIGAQDFPHRQLRCYSVSSPLLTFDRKLIHDRGRILYQSNPTKLAKFDSIPDFQESIRHQVAFFPLLESLEGPDVQYSPHADANRLQRWSSDTLVSWSATDTGDLKAVLEIEFELRLSNDERRPATFRREAVFGKTSGFFPVDVKNAMVIDGQTLQLSHVLTEWKQLGNLRVPTRMNLSKNPQMRKGASQWQLALEWKIGDQLPMVFLVDEGLSDWREAVRLSFDEDWKNRKGSPFFPGYFVTARHADGTVDTDDFCYGDRRHAELYHERLAKIFPASTIHLHYAENAKQRDDQRNRLKAKTTDE